MSSSRQSPSWRYDRCIRTYSLFFLLGKKKKTIEAVEFVPADLFGAATDETPSKKNAKKTAPLVLTAGEKGVLRVWNTETGAMAYEQRLNIGGTASQIVQAL